MIIRGSIIILSLVSPTIDDYYIGNGTEPGIELQVYKSPTLDQPYDTYRDKQIQEITDRIFIETVNDAK